MGTYEYHDHFQEVGENRQIQFDCPKGFMLIGECILSTSGDHKVAMRRFPGGPNKATCLNGTWRPKFTPVCVPQEHPQLEDRPDWSNLRNKRSADLSSSEEYEIVPMGSELRPYLRLTRKRRSPSDNSQYVVLSVRPPKRKRRRSMLFEVLRTEEIFWTVIYRPQKQDKGATGHRVPYVYVGM